MNLGNFSASSGTSPTKNVNPRGLTPFTPKIEGVPVYFEVVDPDDLSPYEGRSMPGPASDPQDRNPNDNRDPAKSMIGGTLEKYQAYQSACLTSNSAASGIEIVSGTSSAVARTTVKITNRYSGDNYRVRAVCRDPSNMPFDALSGTAPINTASTDLNPITSGIKPVVNPDILESCTLVAWKRIYLEYDQMYKMGGTLTSAFTVVTSGSADDTLTLDDSNDFSVGDAVTIFDIGGITKERIVKAKTATTISVAHLDVPFAKHSGVKLKLNNDLFDLPLDMTQGYGDLADGTDGGGFTEVERGILTGNGPIPKYTKFPISPLDVVAFEFCDHWFERKGDKNNVLQIVAANEHADSSLGTTEATRTKNICFVTIGEHTAATLPQVTAAHEIAHQFPVTNSHVDSNTTGARNHEDSDGCIMSYTGTVDTDGHTEFDIDCLGDMRDAIDKL